MALPNQNIPDSKKGKKWAEDTVGAIIRGARGQYNQSYKDRICYNIYAGIQNEQDFEYLTKQNNKTYPAKMRFIPILRTKVDRLISEESSRPLKYRVYSIDMDTIKNKEDAKLSKILDTIKSGYMDRLQQLDDTAKKLQELAGNQDPEAQMQGAQLQGQMDRLAKETGFDQIVAQEDLDEIGRYYKYDYRTINEEYAEKGLRYLMERYELPNVFNQGFKDALVTDREIYFVDHKSIDEDPYVRRVNPMYFFHSTDDEATFLGEHEWVMEVQYLTIPQIIDEFKDELTSGDMEKLQDMADNFGVPPGVDQGFISDYETGARTGEDCGPYGISDYSTLGKVAVFRTRWLSVRPLKFTKTPSKHEEGVFFTHLVSDADKPKKDDEIEIKYVNDVWEGVRIGSDIYVRCRKCPVQLRSIDKIGKVENGYIGHSYNYKDKRPYSLIWAAKDIQMLYNIIYYHQELWIALSGVKGFVMDHSQKPTGMSTQEWMYYRKIGTIWIESVKDGANIPFNQFTTYDDTLPQNISVLVEMLQYLDDLAGMITGVTRQRMGQTEAADPVRGTQMSIENSSMVTEYLFYRHELLKKKAMNRLINLTRLAWKNGKRGQYVLGDMGQEVLNIDGDVISSSEYEVFMANSAKEAEKVQEIRQLAMANFQAQGMSLDQMVKLYDLDNLREMQTAIDKMAKQASQRMAESAKGQQDAELQKELALLQKQQDFDGMVEKGKSNIEMMKLELEKAKMQQEGILGHGDLGLRDKELNSEREVEMSYLNEEARQADNENAIEIAKMASESSKPDKPAAPKKKSGSEGGAKKSGKEKVKD
jgi:hypothetical protein